MDILEISPPKHLTFCVPTDLQRILTLTNLTLRPVLIKIIHSHDHQISINPISTTMEAFQQLKIEVTLHWTQSAKNFGVGKMRIYIWEIYDGMKFNASDENLLQKQHTHHEDITIDCVLEHSLLNCISYVHTAVEGRLTYKEATPSHLSNYRLQKLLPSASRDCVSSEQFKKSLFQYVQSIGNIKFILPCQSGESYLIQFIDLPQDVCEFYCKSVNAQQIVFVLARIIEYGSPSVLPSIVNIAESGPSKVNYPEKSENEAPSVETVVVKEIPHEKQLRTKQQVKREKISLVKQTFIEDIRRPERRRNKSEEKKRESEESVPFIFNVPAEPKKAKVTRQLLIDFNQKILSIYVQDHTIYVLLRDCLKVFSIEDISAKRTIKFDAIDEDNARLPCPVDLYKDEQFAFGNQCYFFWIDLKSGESDWKYVQRKEIYALASIEPLQVFAVGGKNFSKLAYLGKETARSNIKLYGATKHDHLLTYDLPGTNVGNVMALIYLAKDDLLLTQTQNTQGKHGFHFLRVKSYNVITVHGIFDSQELGITRLLKLKYNRASGRVLCLQNLGEIDYFKRLRITFEEGRVEIFTEGTKLPLGRFISYHMGNGGSEEWISLVDQNGKRIHIYDVEANRDEWLDIQKGDVKQVFWVGSEAMLVCSETYIRMRVTSYD